MSMRLFFTKNINIFCQEYQYEIVIAFYSDITQPFFHFSDEEKEKTAVHFRKYEIETFVSATDPPKTPENLIWSAPEVFRGGGLPADVHRLQLFRCTGNLYGFGPKFCIYFVFYAACMYKYNEIQYIV